LWGQSLHFTLQNESLYLNVLVCADAEGNEKDSCELVGFVILFSIEIFKKSFLDKYLCPTNY